MKYYIIAGEASGDLHGSNLMKALQEEDVQAQFRIWGGDLMQNVGGTLVRHYRDLAFMGFVEVIANLKTITANLKFCKEDVAQYQPDVLILIDYPGFNLRIAEWAASKGIRVFYYISPQIWAWHTSRVHQIKKVVEQMFVVLPFESAFYAKYDYKVNYLGHPLLDVVEQFRANLPTAVGADFKSVHQLNEQPIIALLPGSRKQEVERMLKEMLLMVGLFPNYQFVIAGAPSLSESFYRDILAQSGFLTHHNLKLVHHQTYDLLNCADAALVTSGTATLETALFDVPQVVCYKANPISYQIGKRLVNVKYISLVNLIADEKIVPELIQDQLNAKTLDRALQEIIQNKANIVAGYQKVKLKLGESGASKRVAKAIYAYLA
jgi:lipid-A-disaccharide synthase